MLEAFKSAAVLLGDVMCPGAGKHLLARALGRGKNRTPSVPPKFTRLQRDHATSFLVTGNTGIWKMSLATLCSTMTHAEMDALLVRVLSEKHEDGSFKCHPRLRRYRDRMAAGRGPIGDTQFKAGRKLYKHWSTHSEWPVKQLKCRVPEQQVMAVCVWIWDACSRGWRPNDTRARVVGNKVIRFSYFLRDTTKQVLENAFAVDTSVIGRKVLRLLLRWLTAELGTKECCSYFYTRFISCCLKMHTDVLEGFKSRALQAPGWEQLPIYQLDEKIVEVAEMVRFAKHDLKQKHLCVDITAEGHDNRALHCVAHCLGACPHCTCPRGFCKDACHPGVCPPCEKFRRWGVNIQLFVFEWKNILDRAYEKATLTYRGGVDGVTQFHQVYVSLYEPTPMPADIKVFTTTSCQAAKQYAYMPLYITAHFGRGLWQAAAGKKCMEALMSLDDNAAMDLFFLISDHRSKQKPSKSETEQRYDMGLRGMSMQGFQLHFVVEQDHIPPPPATSHSFLLFL